MSNLRVCVFPAVSLIHLYLLNLQMYLDIFPSLSFIVFYDQHYFFPLLLFPSLQPPAELVGFSLFTFFIPSSGLKIIHSISVL